MRRLFEGLAGLDVPVIHFGTGTAGLLGAMADAGGDVIGLDWRIGLADGWSLVPGRAVQGNLDPAVLLAGYEATPGRRRTRSSTRPPVVRATSSTSATGCSPTPTPTTSAGSSTASTPEPRASEIPA